MTKVGAVVLARLSSSRLPRKQLMRIRDKECILYTLERVSKVFSKDSIIVATSEDVNDDDLAEVCISHGYNVFRGSLENVADRFIQASKYLGLTHAFRINGDSLLVDWKLLMEMTNFVLANNILFVSNVRGRTYPIGMSLECVNVNYFLEHLDEIIQSASYSEHVTLYFYEKVPDNIISFYNIKYPEMSGKKFALDTQDDFLFLSNIVNKFEHDHLEYNLEEISKLI